MLATQITWKSGGRILSLALLGGVTLSPLLGDSAPSAHAAPHEAPAAQTWLSFEGPWLCRTWIGGQPVVTTLPGAATAGQHWQAGAGWFGVSDPASGTTTHCTLRWHLSADGRLVSDLPTWVDDPTGELPASDPRDDAAQYHSLKSVPLAQPKAKPRPPTAKPRPPQHPPAPPTQPTQPAPPSGGGYGTPGPWKPVPGHPTYGMGDFAGDPYSGFFGVCTWYAWYRHRGEPLMRLGNAAQWAYNAPRFGLRVGATPVAGATAVFQPGVEGAGGGGHAAHVEVVLGGGWFILSEMNYYWNGGGWGRVDWRFAYAGSGVSFIY